MSILVRNLMSRKFVLLSVGVAVAAAFALTVFAIGAERAEAQSVKTLVSNIAQADGAAVTSITDTAVSQPFRTGSKAAGYYMTRLDAKMLITDYEKLQVTVHPDASFKPGTSLGTLTGPAENSASSTHTNFSFYGGIQLDPSTVYWIVFECTTSAECAKITNTASNAEDSGGEAGWSIVDTSYKEPTTPGASWTGVAGEKLKIRIEGSDTIPNVPNVNLTEVCTTSQQGAHVNWGSVSGATKYKVEWYDTGQPMSYEGWNNLPSGQSKEVTSTSTTFDIPSAESLWQRVLVRVTALNASNTVLAQSGDAEHFPKRFDNRKGTNAVVPVLTPGRTGIRVEWNSINAPCITAYNVYWAPASGSYNNTNRVTVPHVEVSRYVSSWSGGRVIIRELTTNTQYKVKIVPTGPTTVSNEVEKTNLAVEERASTSSTAMGVSGDSGDETTGEVITRIDGCITDLGILNSDQRWLGEWYWRYDHRQVFGYYHFDPDLECNAHHRGERPARYFEFTLRDAAKVTFDLSALDAGAKAALFVSSDTRDSWGAVPKKTYENRISARLANGKLLHNATPQATLTLPAGDYTVEAAAANTDADNFLLSISVLSTTASDGEDGTTDPVTTPDTAPTVAVTSKFKTHYATVGEAFSLVLPAADADSGNGGPYTYSLLKRSDGTAFSANGLSFAASTRTLSGTPTAEDTHELAYHIHDSDTNKAKTDAFVEETKLKILVLPGGGVGGDTEQQKTEPANRAPSFDSGIVTTLSVDENSAAATKVGSAITATDPDTDDKLTYSLTGTDAASFDIGSSTGQITTKTGVTYNYEAKSSYSLAVNVYDGSLSSSTPVTVNLNDVAEAPTVSDTTQFKNHAAKVGQAFSLTLPAADENSGDGGPYEYLLWHRGAGKNFATQAINGLSFNAATRTLSGTPAAAGVWQLSYVVHDDDSDRGAEDRFRAKTKLQITVSP